MKQLRIASRLVWPSLLVLGLALPAVAQQGRPRRVFTNEDVASPAPAPSTEAAPPPSPAATTTPESGDAAASEGQSPQVASVSGLSSDPMVELQTIMELQAALGNPIQLYTEKAELEQRPGLKTRWQSVASNLTNVFLEAQRRIDELRAQLKIEAAPAPPAQ